MVGKFSGNGNVLKTSSLSRSVAKSALKSGPEPSGERFLTLLLCPCAVQRRDSLSGRRQWDMNTWNLFRARVLWDELHQEAFAAGLAVLVLGAKVHASGGILENKPWPPGFAR